MNAQIILETLIPLAGTRILIVQSGDTIRYFDAETEANSRIFTTRITEIGGGASVSGCPDDQSDSPMLKEHLITLVGTLFDGDHIVGVLPGIDEICKTVLKTPGNFATNMKVMLGIIRTLLPVDKFVHYVLERIWDVLAERATHADDRVGEFETAIANTRSDDDFSTLNSKVLDLVNQFLVPIDV